MRMIFENDGEEDFFEIILNDEEIEDLRSHKGVLMDFSYGFRNLNVFVRNENLREVSNAISQRKSSEVKKRILGKHKKRNGSRQAPEAGGGHSL